MNIVTSRTIIKKRGFYVKNDYPMEFIICKALFLMGTLL